MRLWESAEACEPMAWEKSGGVVLEGLMVVYIFWGFYIVTDVFFLPAITVLVEKLHVPDDLAGATILGAALNSPELFSNLIGIFILKNPVGLGLVMGSFNFNILCISGFTAILSRQHLRSRQLKLEWRYLQRDAGMYLLAVILLVYVAQDQLLEAWECFALIALYVVYVVICVLTGRIARLFCGSERKPRRKRPLKRLLTEALGEDWARTHIPADIIAPVSGSVWGATPTDLETPFLDPSPGDLTPKSDMSDPVTPTHESMQEMATELRQVLNALLTTGYKELHNRPQRTASMDLQNALEEHSLGERTLSAPVPQRHHSHDSRLQHAPEPAQQPVVIPQINRVLDDVADSERQLNLALIERVLTTGSATEINYLLEADARLIAVAVDKVSHRQFATDVMESALIVEETYEEQHQQHEHILQWPKSSGLGVKLSYILTLPMTAVMSITMSHKRSLYIPTMIVAVGWLALLAYGLDWSAARVGCNMGIKDELIGITVVAIGTSMPNVFAAVVAGSKGQVETSISQAFGSNIFDILVALGLPYFMLCASQGWEPVKIEAGNVSKDGLIDIAVLLVYVGLLFFFRMRLTKVQGWICIGLYCTYCAYEIIDFLVLSKSD